jgi:hypothetical protein
MSTKKNGSPEFKVGDRVGFVNVQPTSMGGDDTDFGTVAEIISSGKVRVNWDRRIFKNNEYQYTNRLLTEEDARKEASRLDAEFQDLESEVLAKMVIAGQAITEAQKLAKQLGVELAMLDISPLIDAMNQAGWRTSSLDC